MSQNDFYVALQSIFDKAKQAGWSQRQIESDSTDALMEWLEEEGYYEDD